MNPFRAFADWVIRRASGKPKLVARRADGKVFMRCWQPLPFLHIHQLVRCDDPVFHDHEWDFASLILRGSYVEITPDGWRRYDVGSFRFMRAERWHYIEVEDAAWSLVISGPRRQPMGFLVDGNKMSAQEYVQRRAQGELK